MTMRSAARCLSKGGIANTHVCVRVRFVLSISPNVRTHMSHTNSTVSLIAFIDHCIGFE